VTVVPNTPLIPLVEKYRPIRELSMGWNILIVFSKKI
jgi:hypothetical protein